ncbi:MAG: ADP/ATP-dependent (S)-NAD(P)H-hydrate dehydratase [Dermabacter sp.]|nr:ADP/ATP-dependent (S)-NAD(P)H-hydrate dehydratase [Dermabacter sp.]
MSPSQRPAPVGSTSCSPSSGAALPSAPVGPAPDPVTGARFLPAALTRPTPADHKYTRGVLTLATGSDAYPGAALLGTEAAARCGIGMVRYDGPDAVARLVIARTPEVVPRPGRSQAWVLGSGWEAGQADASRVHERVRAILARASDDAAGAFLVLDAGALLAVPNLADECAPFTTVLTPHAGEAAALAARLVGGIPAGPAGDGSSAGKAWTRARIEAHPEAAARDLAERSGAIVVLKGHTTVVASPGGAPLTVTAPTTRLATAGTGDVLAGMIGALLALNHGALCHTALYREGPTGSGGPASDAPASDAVARTVAAAVELHGLCAREAAGAGEAPILAHDLARVAPRVIARVQAEAQAKD